MADSVNNGANNSNSSNSNTVVGVGSIYIDPYNERNNPLNDVHTTGSDSPATVRDVEEIVNAVRDSFANYIDIQRQYIDSDRAEKSQDDGSSDSDDDDDYDGVSLQDDDSDASVEEKEESNFRENKNEKPQNKEIDKDESNQNELTLRDDSGIISSLKSDIDELNKQKETFNYDLTRVNSLNVTSEPVKLMSEKILDTQSDSEQKEKTSSKSNKQYDTISDLKYQGKNEDNSNDNGSENANKDKKSENTKETVVIKEKTVVEKTTDEKPSVSSSKKPETKETNTEKPTVTVNSQTVDVQDSKSSKNQTVEEFKDNSSYSSKNDSGSYISDSEIDSSYKSALSMFNWLYDLDEDGNEKVNNSSNSNNEKIDEPVKTVQTENKNKEDDNSDKKTNDDSTVTVTTVESVSSKIPENKTVESEKKTVSTRENATKEEPEIKDKNIKPSISENTEKTKIQTTNNEKTKDNVVNSQSTSNDGNDISDSEIDSSYKSALSMFNWLYDLDEDGNEKQQPNTEENTAENVVSSGNNNTVRIEKQENEHARNKNEGDVKIDVDSNSSPVGSIPSKMSEKNEETKKEEVENKNEESEDEERSVNDTLEKILDSITKNGNAINSGFDEMRNLISNISESNEEYDNQYQDNGSTDGEIGFELERIG